MVARKGSFRIDREWTNRGGTAFQNVLFDPYCFGSRRAFFRIILRNLQMEVMLVKKLLPVLLAAVLLSGCAAAEAPYHVGLCQLTTHAALDEATQGFIHALEDRLGAGNAEIDLKYAIGDQSTCTAIITDFVANDVDLIVANGTAALQAAAAATGDIPILGMSVTEYGVALDIDAFNGTPGGNVSGACDLAPLDKQAQMIADLFEQARTVALLYCSAEPNSQYQVKVVGECLTQLGLTPIPYPFADSNDMAIIAQAACDSCDVIYTPTDNTVAANAGILDNICRPAQRPVITGDTGTCRIAGAAVLGISYYDLGATAGRMAAEVLTGAADISTLPVAFAQHVTYYYNPDVCEELGLDVPDGYIPLRMD